MNPWGLVAPNPNDFWDSNNSRRSSTRRFVPVAYGHRSPHRPVDGTLDTHRYHLLNTTCTLLPMAPRVESAFIWATEDGAVAGWSPRVSSNGTSPSTQAFLGVDNSASGGGYRTDAGDPRRWQSLEPSRRALSLRRQFPRGGRIASSTDPFRRLAPPAHSSSR